MTAGLLSSSQLESQFVPNRNPEIQRNRKPL
jgi:hypothetical protein